MALSPQPLPTDVEPMTLAELVVERQPTNVRWLGLLVLTALAVALGTSLTLRGASQADEEQRQFGRELRLQTQVAQLSSQLHEAELCQAAYIGTGRADYATRFRRLHTTLSDGLRDLTAPQDFGAPRELRLKQLPSQASAYLNRLESAAALREAGQSSQALAALEEITREGDRLQKSVALVARDSKKASDRSEQAHELESQRLRAEAIVRATLFALVLLLAYLLLRVERRFQVQRVKTLQRENERLRELTEEDGLTGLSNRRAFDNRLDIEWQRAQRYGLPLSLVVLDVDHFKQYNDSFGHQAGDVILRLMAHALAQTARLSDTVARYGGEEFALILPHTDADEAMIVGERLRALLLRSDWPNRPITASIGVSTMNKEKKTSAELVHEADSALYTAKGNGRNQVTHWSQVKQEAKAP
ncbi:GGDEF domain-containing protein [Armatimonas sp.]|uniref:GGDEF domain-containing protein n=1 Tax=Armatimonas sp. TaxID=1872638 RepID=UPI00286A4574|nr:GGDEF domain-containing protein [Armatimonas sp.]